MKALLTATVLFLLAGFAFGQQNFKPGYFVNLQGDTIKGLINYKGETRSAQICTFKPSENASITDYAPTEIKAYGFENGKLYQSIKEIIVNHQLNELNKYDTEPVEEQPSVNFMNVLVKGKATLYTLTDITGKQHFYLQKDDEKIQEIYHLKAVVTDPKTGLKQMYSSRQFTGIFISAFQDCPSVQPLIQKTEFKESEMQKLVVAYNACSNPNAEVRSVERPKSRISWGSLAGISNSNLDLDDGYFLEYGTYTARPSITAGLYMNLTVPQLNEKLSIQNSLMFVRRKYNGGFNLKGATYTYPFYNPTPPSSSYPFQYNYNYDVTFNLNYIEAASQLRYTVPKGNLRPFISGGVSLGQVIKHKQEIIFTDNLNQPEPKQYPAKTDYLSIRSTEQGFIGSLGVLYHLPSDKKVSLETRIQRSNGFIRYWEGRTKTHTLTVLVGLEL